MPRRRRVHGGAASPTRPPRPGRRAGPPRPDPSSRPRCATRPQVDLVRRSRSRPRSAVPGGTGCAASRRADRVPRRCRRPVPSVRAPGAPGRCPPCPDRPAGPRARSPSPAGIPAGSAPPPGRPGRRPPPRRPRHGPRSDRAASSCRSHPDRGRTRPATRVPTVPGTRPGRRSRAAVRRTAGPHRRPVGPRSFRSWRASAVPVARDVHGRTASGTPVGPNGPGAHARTTSWPARGTPAAPPGCPTRGLSSPDPATGRTGTKRRRAGRPAQASGTGLTRRPARRSGPRRRAARRGCRTRRSGRGRRRRSGRRRARSTAGARW